MREYFVKGAVVSAIAGREKNNIFLILRSDGDYVWLINGDTRTIENPKKKNIKHIHLLCRSEIAGVDIDTLTNLRTKEFLNNYNKSRVK